MTLRLRLWGRGAVFFTTMEIARYSFPLLELYVSTTHCPKVPYRFWSLSQFFLHSFAASAMSALFRSRERITQKTIAIAACCTVGKPHNITNQTSQRLSYFKPLPVSKTLTTDTALQAAGYQRPPPLPGHPPPPRTSLMISNSISAPMMALIIAAIMPEPRWMPS